MTHEPSSLTHLLSNLTAKKLKKLEVENDRNGQPIIEVQKIQIK